MSGGHGHTTCGCCESLAYLLWCLEYTTQRADGCDHLDYLMLLTQEASR